MGPETAVIVNPAAGAGRSGRRWPRRRAAMERALGPFMELGTRFPGDGAKLASEAVRRGAKRLIAVGGDGSWHEVVEGFLSLTPAEREGVSLGCYPAGSGCDFARHLGLPPEDDGLLGVLAAGKVRMLDAVRGTISSDAGGTETVHLTNIAAFGLAGDVARAVDRTGKPAGGALSYLFVTLGLLIGSKARGYELTLDGNPLEERRFHAVILGNTSTMGGGMRFAPDADAEDGLFELLTIGDLPRFELVRKLGTLYSGRHLKERGISLRRGKLLEARLADGGRPSYLNIDGEARGMLPARFEILPGALPVIVPERPED